ncbi:hypothetical protein FJU08_06865 [Martelella alba]|uniref:Uncharacterized protein n=1 Tax=Martelella alba TaxID=2590451 RepID=A0A506UAS8_9HYPH|nr:hypothetical protein [Martelella alba]TPW31473.1 hypothetical protein FJU08_06865 [Martelella alba]
MAGLVVFDPVTLELDLDDVLEALEAAFFGPVDGSLRDLFDKVDTEKPVAISIEQETFYEKVADEALIEELSNRDIGVIPNRLPPSTYQLLADMIAGGETRDALDLLADLAPEEANLLAAQTTLRLAALRRGVSE